MSFPVNPPAPRLILATSARNDPGKRRFVVDAIATDGGGIPRNDQVASGLALVHLGALSPAEWVLKVSWQGAHLLGLDGKGHLGEGADADVTVVDPSGMRVRTTVANGEIVMHEGIVVGRGASVVTTPRGEDAVRGRGLGVRVRDPGESGMYRSAEAKPWIA